LGKKKAILVLISVVLFIGVIGVAIAQNSKGAASEFESQCSEASARLSFEDVCTGGMFMYAGNDLDKIKAECKCVAKKFTVHKVIYDKKKCKWEATDVFLAREVMAKDSVKLECR
jgi:hypothetical protein